MDKSSEKKPIIPEMNIPDVADYQPSNSALTKFAARTYVLIRTKPRIVAGSLGALALTVASIAFVSAPNGVTTLPPIEQQASDVEAIDQQKLATMQLATDGAMQRANSQVIDFDPAATTLPVPSSMNVDNTIEQVDTEELRTSVKPLDIPSEPVPSEIEELKVAEEQSLATAETMPISPDEPVVDQESKAERLSEPKHEEPAPIVTVEAESEDVSPIVFSERFGESSPPMTEGEAQQALKEALSKIGSIEQSMDNLKSFPFDLVVKPEPDEPKYAVLKIVEGADATSGFWREIEEPAEKPAKGKKQVKKMREEHFLILQAVDDVSGKPIEVDVKDMDSGETKKESSWAVLIPEKQFVDFAQSKQEDGTFSKPILGKFNLETGEIEWEIDTDGRALINWKEFAE